MDVDCIHALTVALARYERKKPSQILVTPEKIGKRGFGRGKIFDSIIAFWDNKPVGMAVFFPKYAGSLGEEILYIEDLFVLPKYRNRGIGTALLADLARLAQKKGCCRMEWCVFRFNKPAIRFYRGLGCEIREDLPQVRLQAQDFGRLLGA